MTVWAVATGSESADAVGAAGPDLLFDDLDGVRRAFFAAALDSAPPLG
jgi:hypothetical protein